MQRKLGCYFQSKIWIQFRAKTRTAQDSPEDLENLAEKFAEEEAREINVEVNFSHHNFERGSNRN